MKREVIRNGFRPKYLAFNVSFIFLLVALTLRTGTYVGLRMVTLEKQFNWVYIKPSVFYLTFATDVMILFWVLHFIYRSAPLKERYQNNSGMNNSAIGENSQGGSIFPMPEGSDAEQEQTPSEGSIDGDKDLEENQSSSSGSSQNNN